MERKLEIYSKTEVDSKGIKIVGTDSKEHLLKLNNTLEFNNSGADDKGKDIDVKVTKDTDGVKVELDLKKSETVQEGDQKAVTSDAVYRKLQELNNNLTKKQLKQL